MKIVECMTPAVRICGPDDTLADAARAMAEADVGCLPVGDPDRLVGMITDRDIAVRAVALGLSPTTKVREIMTAEVRYCHEEDDVEDTLLGMGDIQVRRLPVLDHDQRLVGIVTLSDMADAREQVAGAALCLISRHGGLHTQSTH